MKNKFKMGLFVLIVMGVISLCLTYKNKNEVTKTKRKKQENSLAIMIKADGEENYVKSSSKEIPIGENYYLDYDKSYCKNNGVIGNYDNTTGKVSFSFIGTDSCFLYFEEFIKPNIDDFVFSNDIDDSKILTINIYYNGKSNTISKVGKFTFSGIKSGFSLSQNEGPFLIDLTTFNLYNGYYYYNICIEDIMGNNIGCETFSFEYK